MTFNDLAVGERFMFVGEAYRRNGYPELPETVITYRVKVNECEYTVHFADGGEAWGRVGCGDNPVHRVEANHGVT